MRHDIFIALFFVAIGPYCRVTNGVPVRILPCGDSITHGHYTGVTIYNSYRKELKSMLEINGYNTDFVGSLTNGSFADNQHEGHDGWHADKAGITDDILGQISGWMSATPADIVLLHIGTNDIIADHADTDAAEVSDIVDVIFGANSNATVVLALIIDARPEYGLNVFVSTYNSNLNAMAQVRIANGDDIIVVDMEHGAGINYESADMADSLHPSPAGYDKMATNWYPAVIQAISNQMARQILPPLIQSITVTNNTVFLEMQNLTTGWLVHVEQTGSLTPPAWSNAGSFLPAVTSTNWTGETATNDAAFYRLFIP